MPMPTCRALLVTGALLFPLALTAQERRFTPDVRSGDVFRISTIDGSIRVTQGRGTRAEVIATKRVRKGDPKRVYAVLEETKGGWHLCTVYLQRDEEERETCTRESRSRDRDRDRDDRWSDNVDIEISYEVRLPAGVTLEATTVDGDIAVSGADRPGSFTTVDGSIDFEGVVPRRMTTVDGKILASFTGDLDRDASITSVDGEIDLVFGRGFNAVVTATTIDGEVSSDFPVTTSGRWGPKHYRATIGDGGATLKLNVVDGAIRLRRR